MAETDGDIDFCQKERWWKKYADNVAPELIYWPQDMLPGALSFQWLAIL